MSRIIRTESPARGRGKLLASVREALAPFDAPGLPPDARDRLAFVGLVLRELEHSTEQTAQAWERRGYWVKVDQFRREWAWVGQGAQAVLEPLLGKDLEASMAAARALRPRLPSVATSISRHRSTPWIGAYARLTTNTGTLRRE
jgi:hypothetical protein